MNCFPYVRIRHEKLEMRALEVCHAGLLFDLITKNKKYLGEYFFWAHEARSVESEIERIAASQGDYFSSKELTWGIWTGQPGRLLGTISLFPPDFKRNPFMKEIGYWIAEEHRGRGFATLATKMAVVTAFEKLGCDRVQIRQNCANGASRRVIEKCGFIPEGTLRNVMARPTDDILTAGHTGERAYMLYSFIPDDLRALSWYEEISRNLQYDSIEQITA